MHQALVLFFQRHVGNHDVRGVRAPAVQSVRDGLHAGLRSVTEHHRGTGVVKSFTKCRTDSTSSARDNGDGTGEIHSTMLRRSCVSIIMGKVRDSLSHKTHGRKLHR